MGRENDVVIVTRGWQENKTQFTYLFIFYLCIYFALHKKAWHYPFEPVMISKAELISLPFWSLKTLIIFQSFFYIRIFRTASDFFKGEKRKIIRIWLKPRWQTMDSFPLVLMSFRSHPCGASTFYPNILKIIIYLWHF